MGKWPWLVANLSSFLAEGKVLLFVANRAGCDELSANLSRHLPNGSTVVASIHGDRTQEARDDVIRKVTFLCLLLARPLSWWAVFERFSCSLKRELSKL
jgi:hypothetical protein